MSIRSVEGELSSIMVPSEFVLVLAVRLPVCVKVGGR